MISLFTYPSSLWSQVQIEQDSYYISRYIKGRTRQTQEIVLSAMSFTVFDFSASVLSPGNLRLDKARNNTFSST